MTNKLLEKKIELLEKDMAILKSKVFVLNHTVDDKGEYKNSFVKRVLKNAKDKRRSVVYTNKRDLLKLISK